MHWFRKRATEEHVERATLFAAMLARASERDRGQLALRAELLAFVDLAFKDLVVRPTSKQRQVAYLSVGALLVESRFVEELLAFRLANPTEPLPPGSREKMLAAIERSVNEFMNSQSPS